MRHGIDGNRVRIVARLRRCDDLPSSGINRHQHRRARSGGAAGASVSGVTRGSPAASADVIAIGRGIVCDLVAAPRVQVGQNGARNAIEDLDGQQRTSGALPANDDSVGSRPKLEAGRVAVAEREGLEPVAGCDCRQRQRHGGGRSALLDERGRDDVDLTIGIRGRAVVVGKEALCSVIVDAAVQPRRRRTTGSGTLIGEQQRCDDLLRRDVDVCRERRRLSRAVDHENVVIWVVAALVRAKTRSATDVDCLDHCVAGGIDDLHRVDVADIDERCARDEVEAVRAGQVVVCADTGGPRIAACESTGDLLQKRIRLGVDDID